MQFANILTHLAPDITQLQAASTYSVNEALNCKTLSVFTMNVVIF